MDLASGIFAVVQKLFCLFRSVNCQRTTVILLPEGCGKSHASSNMVSRDGALLLDLESLSDLQLTTDQSAQIQRLVSSGNKQSLLMFLLPLWKTFVKETKVKFRHRDLYVLLSQPDSLDYMKNLIDRKLVFVPSEQFFNTILDKVSEPEKRKSMTASRTAIVARYGAKARVFSSFGDLQSQLAQELAITQRV